MIDAKVIEKSISPAGKVLTTLQLRYPRFIHAEFMTHRVFSRNASSSRAIPAAKLIEEVRERAAFPTHWGANQPGMQAHQQLDTQRTFECMQMWQEAANNAANTAERMVANGLHKQVVNRILEPFSHISVIVTATEWDNFYGLRNHPDAQPEIQALAQTMLEADVQVQPVLRTDAFGPEWTNGWHLPYITAEERAAYPKEAAFLAELSAARCARVSYLTHDGKVPDHEKDIALFERLVGSAPLHASPIEHQAFAWVDETGASRNFRGWTQFRHVYEEMLAGH